MDGGAQGGQVVMGNHGITAHRDGRSVLSKDRGGGTYSGAKLLSLLYALRGVRLRLGNMQLDHVPPIGRNLGPQDFAGKVIPCGKDELRMLARPFGPRDFGGSGVHGANLPFEITGVGSRTGGEVVISGGLKVLAPHGGGAGIKAISLSKLPSFPSACSQAQG